MRERNKYIDVLRGTAVILMVLGHCIQYGNGRAFSQPEVFFNNIAFQLIYSFHMPLFMLISGYLFIYTVEKHRSIISFAKNRFLRLLLPIIAWDTILYIRFAWEAEKTDGWIKEWIISYCKSIPEAYWFLWAIFYCSIAVWIGRYLFRDSIVYYLLGFLLTFFAPEVVDNLYLYKFMYPFFVGGYLFAKNQELIKSKMGVIRTKRLLISLIVVYIVLFLFWDYDCYIYISHYSAIGRSDLIHQIGIDCYRMIIGFVGSAVVILAVKLIYNWIQCKCTDRKWINGLTDAVHYLGKESLGIYIISSHLVEMFLISNLDKMSLNYLNNIIQTIILCGASYLLTYLIRKVKVLNIILLGGR